MYNEKVECVGIREMLPLLVQKGKAGMFIISVAVFNLR